MQLNHVPQRVNTVILRIQRHETGMAAIADMHGVDCGCTIGNGLPDTHASELLASALRQRNRSGVKTWVIRNLRGNGFDKMNRQLPLGELRNRQCQRRASHAATHDDDTHARAAAISASISSAFFTTCAVRFSLPVSVMTMSSSIRMPMPRYSAGTSASGAM
ncbi:hypothetical protein D3C80_776090 [compost metagenome]